MISAPSVGDEQVDLPFEHRGWGAPDSCDNVECRQERHAQAALIQAVREEWSASRQRVEEFDELVAEARATPATVHQNTESEQALEEWKAKAHKMWLAADERSREVESLRAELDATRGELGAVGTAAENAGRVVRELEERVGLLESVRELLRAEVEREREQAMADRAEAERSSAKAHKMWLAADEGSREIERVVSQCAALERQVQDWQSEADARALHVEELEQILSSMSTSRSWRLTTWLRRDHTAVGRPSRSHE